MLAGRMKRTERLEVVRRLIYNKHIATLEAFLEVGRDSREKPIIDVTPSDLC